MASAKIPPALRKRIEEEASGICEYCHTNQLISGIACHIDHIIPTSAGGETELINLCLACPSCNSHKWAKVEAIDPETNLLVPLFNPRTDKWGEHFEWTKPPYRLIGKTGIGRATIDALRINNNLIVSARKIWFSVGLHP